MKGQRAVQAESIGDASLAQHKTLGGVDDDALEHIPAVKNPPATFHELARRTVALVVEANVVDGPVTEEPAVTAPVCDCTFVGVMMAPPLGSDVVPVIRVKLAARTRRRRILKIGPT